MTSNANNIPYKEKPLDGDVEDEMHKIENTNP